MNIRKMKPIAQHKPFVALAAAVSMASLLAGCSGGNAILTSKTVTGTLQDQHKAPIAGAKAVYDSGTPGTLTTVTSATGNYKFDVPLSAITGSDTIMFYNSAGDLIDIENLTLSKNTDSVTVAATTPPVPPTAPPSL